MMSSLLSATCIALLLAQAGMSPHAPAAPPPAVGTASEQKGEEELSPRHAAGRELRGGEAHSYVVRLEAGRYLRAVVEQKGVDVLVRLYGPGGRKLAEVDSPNGTEGPEPVSFIADEGGEYRLEVSALDAKAPAGRYEARVEELRQATARDRALIAAERALAEATLLRTQGTAQGLRSAVGKYEEALPLLRAAQERPAEALTLHSLGFVSWQLGENRQSLEYYNQALPLWRALGDLMNEAVTAAQVGASYLGLGESRKALEHCTQTLPLQRAAGFRLGEAITFSTMGLASDNLGRPREALDYYGRALSIARELGNRREEAVTLSNMGLAHERLGELQKAVEDYDQALTLQRAMGDRRGEAITLNNIGTVYFQLGEYQKALEYHTRALPPLRLTGERLGEFSTLNNIGAALFRLGEPRKALEHYEQAVSLARALGDRRSEANTLSNMGETYRQLGEYQKALDLHNRALPLRRTAGDRWGEAVNLLNIGVDYVSLGRPDEALDYLGRALSLLRDVGDQSREAVTLHGMARAELARGHLGQARARIEEALAIVEGTRSKLFSRQLRAAYSASRQDYYESYIDILMRMHRAEPAAGLDAEALRVSERARARGLLEMLTESQADVRRGVDAVLLGRERSLQLQLSAKAERLTRLLSGRHTEEQESAARKEVEALLDEYQEVEALIRQRSPRYASLTQPRPLSAGEIQRLLDQDTLLLEYSLGEERSYLWAVTRASVESFELPKRDEIESRARLVYDLFTARKRSVSFEPPAARRARVAEADTAFLSAAGELSRLLLGRLAGRLKHKRLLIVGDGMLQYLPFAALPLPDSGDRGARQPGYTPLITRHEIISLPSASTLSELRKELAGRAPAPKTVAVLADPVFSGNDARVHPRPPETPGPEAARVAEAEGGGGARGSRLTRAVRDLAADDDEAAFPLPRLPYSRREADAITALAPAGQSAKALDFEASRAAATDPGLSQYRYVHFATHVVLNPRHPELSGVVLSLVDNEGREQDGFLLAHEVYNLNLPAELVVLSGCRTGLGKEMRGEGLVGLTRGFMYAGAGRVLVSLWDVNDRSTAELMSRFYEGVLGKERLRPAAALRRAQLQMWRSSYWRAPYYWGAFVLQGEYR